jgi:hypothetical protein
VSPSLSSLCYQVGRDPESHHRGIAVWLVGRGGMAGLGEAGPDRRAAPIVTMGPARWSSL